MDPNFGLILVIGISTTLLCGALGQTNVALGGTCDSYPTHDGDKVQFKECSGAFDGVISSSTPHRWAFLGSPLNSWIMVTFNQAYFISTASIVALPTEKTFRDIQLEFDDNPAFASAFTGVGNPVTHVLSSTGTIDFIKEDVVISPARYARRVRLLVLTTYLPETTDLSKSYNGLVEVEYYGTTTTTSTTTTTATTTTTTPPTTTTTTTTKPTTTTTTTFSPVTTTTTTTIPTTITTTTTTTTKPTTTTTTTTSPTTTTTTPGTTTTVKAEESSGDENKSLVPIIAGAAAGGFLLIIIIIIVICLRQRRKKGRLPEEESPVPMTDVQPEDKGISNGGFQPDVVPHPEPPVSTPPLVPPPSRPVSDYNDNEEDIYQNPPILESEPIEVEDLPDYITKVQDGPRGFSPEFARLPKGPVYKTSYGSRDSVRVKNRFRNIIPYDQTRVKLKEQKGKKHSSYYNANYIEGQKSKWQYIAAQGPLEGTVADFWRLVWEQDSPKVIMVTNLKESGRDKCYKYWPDTSEKYGELKVTNLVDETVVLPDYTIKAFQLEKGVVKKVVGHFHYTTWPDEGVPDAATSLITFHELIMSSKLGNGKGPLVIHCSAGVGRTGTLIALDRMSLQAKEEGKVDILRCVSAMRTDRMSMVQSVDQYEFIYLSLVEKLLCTDVQIPSNMMSNRLPNLLTNIPGKDLNIIEQQFNILDVFRIRVPDSLYETGRSAENKSKNRDDTVLPGEYNRPYLSPLPDYKNSYINAVFVRGYRRRDAFIVTQMPLDHTQLDFWRMLMDFKSKTIVMLNSLDSAEQINCDAYWPEGRDEKTKEIGPFTVTKVSSTVGSRLQTTELKVKSKGKDKETRHVTHHRLLDWMEGSGFPENKSSLLALYKRIQANRVPGDESPIIVHCMFGDDRSGLYCSMSVMCEMIDNEQVVDVFNPVRRARRARTQFIPNVEQFRYLYELADEYIGSPPTGEDVVEEDDDGTVSEAGTIDPSERTVIKIEMED